MIRRHWSGRSRYTRLRIMVLMATDLPEPVVPAISICGVRARSMMMDSPPMFLPRHSGSFATDSLWSFTDSNSRK